MEFAVLMGMVMTVVIAVQYGVRSAVQTAEYNITSSVLQQPVVAPVGYALPRTGCIDTTGDGICDCLDSDRDAACDPVNSQSGSLSQETGPAAGRTTVITETSTGNSSSEYVNFQPIMIPGTASTSAPAPLPSPATPPAHLPPPGVPEVQQP